MAPRSVKGSSALEYGKSGEASLVKLDENRARFDFADGESVTLQVKIGDIFEDKAATLPIYVPFKAMQAGKSIKVRCSFEKGDKRILFINPLSGELQVKFVRFQAPEGSEPVWIEKQGKGNRPYREAPVFVEVVDGRWKGCVIRARIFDNFALWEEDGFCTVRGEGTGSNNLRDFSDAVGFDYTTIPYSENLLPLIQKTALENAKTFSAVLVNGYVSNYVPGLDSDAFGDEYGDVPDLTPENKDEVNDLLRDQENVLLY